MSEARLRGRTRLKRKEARELVEALRAACGACPFGEEDAVERGEVAGLVAYVVNNEPLALERDGQPFLTVKGLLRVPDAGKWVTVDMGAVKFVTNGADVMCPGIVEADAGIAPGAWVWVRDQKNKRPLAVGRALLSGAELARMGKAKEKGKGVETVHFVGDALWSLEA